MKKNWYFDRRICRNGQHRAMLKAANGETVIPTEQYTQKQGLSKGIAAIMANAASPEAYVRCIAADGRPYFNIKSLGNHKIIAGPSQTYSSTQAMEDTIAAMIANVPHADIITNVGFWWLRFETLYGE